MTYGELVRDVIDLGFESNTESDTVLLSAINRVLMLLWRYEPAVMCAELNQRAPLWHRSEEQTLRELLTVTRCGAGALSFEGIGQGHLSVSVDGETVMTRTVSAPEWRTYRLALSRIGTACVQIRPEEKGSFSLRNLALLAGAHAPATIPLWGSDTVRYDLSALCGGTPEPDAPPTDGAGLRLDYQVQGGELLLPTCHRDRVLLRLRRMPRLAVLEDLKANDTVPDCPPRLHDLLALGVASYVWLETDPDKATYYKTRFDEGLAMDRMQQQHRGDVSVIKRKGW